MIVDPDDIATHVPVDNGDDAVLARLGATWRNLARLFRTSAITVRKYGTHFSQGARTFLRDSRLATRLGRQDYQETYGPCCVPCGGR